MAPQVDTVPPLMEMSSHLGYNQQAKKPENKTILESMKYYEEKKPGKSIKSD